MTSKNLISCIQTILFKIIFTKIRYTNTQTKTEQNFRKKKPQWGAGPNGKTPEEDWSRFTKDFEEDNPNFWKKYEEEFEATF